MFPWEVHSLVIDIKLIWYTADGPGCVWQWNLSLQCLNLLQRVPLLVWCHVGLCGICGKSASYYFLLNILLSHFCWTTSYLDIFKGQTIPCHQYGSCFWLGFLESIPFSYFFFKQLVAVKLNGGLHILCWSWVVRLRDSKKNVKISIITAVDWTCWLIISCNMTLFKLCHFGQKYCCGHHFICFALPHNLLRL